MWNITCLVKAITMSSPVSIWLYIKAYVNFNYIVTLSNVICMNSFNIWYTYIFLTEVCIVNQFFCQIMVAIIVVGRPNHHSSHRLARIILFVSVWVEAGEKLFISVRRFEQRQQFWPLPASFLLRWLRWIMEKQFRFGTINLLLYYICYNRFVLSPI